MEERYDRNIRFFGVEGQKILGSTTVAVVGIGGLGTHVVQQLSHLGVKELILIDEEELDKTNLNRYVGSRHDDPIPGTRKVDLGERIANLINPAIHIQKIFNTVVSSQAFEALSKSDYIFGCLDNDGPRFILNEVCSAYCLPYFDLASEIDPGSSLTYGGRVAASWDGKGCLFCLDTFDMREVQDFLEGPETKLEKEAIYGVSRELLTKAGPSVVSINGVIASLAVTEFTVGITGIRRPHDLTKYYGHFGKVTVSKDQLQNDCYYCKTLRGAKENAGLERYIQRFHAKRKGELKWHQEIRIL